MGQKCPICKRVLNTDGVDPGKTMICPGCGTGVVVDQSSLFSSQPAPQPVARQSSTGAGNGAGQVGSYSLRFDGAHLRSETVFGNEPQRQAALKISMPEPPRPEVHQSTTQAKPVNGPAFLRDMGVDVPDGFADVDPDATMGFGLEDLPLPPPRSADRPAEIKSDAGTDMQDFLHYESDPFFASEPVSDHSVADVLEPDQEYVPTQAMRSAAFDDDLGVFDDDPSTERIDRDLSLALGDDDFGIPGGDGGHDDLNALIDEVDYREPPEEAAPLTVDLPASRGRKVKARKGADSVPAAPPKKAKSSGGGKRSGALVPTLLVILVIAFAGAVLGLTDYGYFGINFFTGGQKSTDSYFKTIESKIQVMGDSRESYVENIRRADRAYVEDDSEENLGRLFGLLNMYRERYPAAFAKDVALIKRLNDLKGLAGKKNRSVAGMSQVTELLNQGKYAEARAVLDSMMMASAQDVEALYYYGKIAMGTGKPEEAQKYFEIALIRNPGMISPKYFLAEALVAQERLLEAKAHLSEIMGKDPRHLPSRVLAAKIAIKENDFDQARLLAGEVITIGTPGVDTNDIFEAHRILAKVHEAAGDDDARQNELKSALSLKPADEPTVIEAGRLMIEKDRRSGLVDMLRPCREAGCSSEDFLLVFASAAYLEEEVELAEAAVAEGVQKYPQSPRFPVLVGRYHLTKNHFRAAEDALKKAIELDPAFIEAYELLAKALKMEGKFPEAIQTLVQGMGVFGEKSYLMVLMADIQIDMKDVVGAEGSLRKAVQLEPDNDSAQMRLGMVVKQQGRNDEAAAILNILEKKRALDFDGTVALADAYLEVGESSRAKAILEKLVADNPDRPEAANALGRALGQCKEYDKAKDVLVKVRVRFPANPWANLYLGDVYMALKDFQQAISYYTDAVKLDGENYGFRLALARAYLALDTVDGETEARKQLDVIIAAYAGDEVPQDQRVAEVYLLRGRIHFEREKYPQAMKDFQDALSLAPSRRDIMVEFGKSLYEMGRYDDAVPYFKQVIGGDAQNPDANYFLGRVYLRQGDQGRSIDYLVASVKRNPSRFPDAHRLLGLIYRDRGLETLARDSFKAYLRYVPDRKSSEAIEVQRMLERDSY